MWCDNDQYPRNLTEIIGEKAEHRCACFKERGSSRLRQLYPGCKPDATRCMLQPPAQEEPPVEEAHAKEEL